MRIGFTTSSTGPVLNYPYVKLKCAVIFHDLRVKCQDIFVVSSNE